MIDDRDKSRPEAPPLVDPVETGPLSPYERTIFLAKQGAVDPRQLSDQEIRLLCRMLLTEYAKLGIS